VHQSSFLHRASRPGRSRPHGRQGRAAHSRVHRGTEMERSGAGGSWRSPGRSRSSSSTSPQAGAGELGRACSFLPFSAARRSFLSFSIGPPWCLGRGLVLVVLRHAWITVILVGTSRPSFFRGQAKP
jgi:hypothetical protein